MPKLIRVELSARAPYSSSMQRRYKRSDTLIWAEAVDLSYRLAAPWGRQDDALMAAEAGLDIQRLRELINQLGAHAAVSSPRSLAYAVRDLTPEEEQVLVPLFNELHQQTELLRRAARSIYEHQPGKRQHYVIATIDEWRDVFDLGADIAEPLAYRSVTMQDLVPQVPDAIEEFTAISRFEKIELLVLFGNQLTGLPFDVRPLRALRYVDLSQNCFESFPLQLLDCRALEGIALSSNSIQTLPTSLAEMPHLRELLIDRNPLPPGEADRIRAALPGVHVIS